MGRDHIRYLTRQFYLKLPQNHFYLPKICLHNANGPFVFRKLRNTVSAVCLCSLVTKLGGAYLTKKMTLVEMTDAFWFQPSKLWHDFRPFKAKNQIKTHQKNLCRSLKFHNEIFGHVLFLRKQFCKQ